jgi:hypothetical protein
MSHDALKIQVAAAVSSIPSRNVVIVDDEQPYADFPTQEAWSELKDALQEVPTVYGAFLTLCEVAGRSPDEPPPAELIQNIVKELGEAGTQLTGALALYAQSKHVLAQIRDLLRELGFSVSMHSHTPELDSSAPPFLVLVDFHFEGEEHEGQNAERTIGALMRPSFRVPPFVLLMSKRLDPADCERWMKIAERSGFFRFNYDFLPKQAIQHSSAYLYFAILNFVQHSAVSETYFQQMRTLEAEAKRIAETVTKEIFQVTPPEAQMFARRMRTEGQPLGQVFTDLFVQHLASAIENSISVRAAMKVFEDALVTEGLPTAEIREHGNLHKLYSQLLHSTAVDSNAAPSFGDIFENGGGGLYLVLSQECDIASGDGRNAKSDRVLALEGILQNRAAEGQDGPIVSKPFWEAGRPQRWLWWNLRKPAVLPYSSLFPHHQTSLDSLEGDPPRLRRRFKLRFAEAEEIQNAFAFNLARVATDVLPSPITKFRCNCANELPDGCCTLGEPLCFYMLVLSDERYISVAPESKVASLGTDEHPFLPAELALQLSRFVSINQFKKLLQQNKIMPIAGGSELRTLLKFKARTPKGVSEWTGK